MDDRDLLVIKYLNEFRNITKTANSLFLSQPALTRRIQQIERELDTHLITSSNKGIQFTPTGIEAVLFANKVLQEYDEFKKRLESIDKKSSQLIKLTAPNIICEYYFPSLIRAFKEIYPNVHFTIVMAPSSEVVSLMNNDESDFGFLRNDFGWDDTQKILLTTNYIAAVSTTPFKLKDLAYMSRVAYSTDNYYMKMLDLWWKNNFSTTPHIDVQVNSLNLCREMVLNGIGFGLLPSILVPDTPKIHKLILNDKNGKPIKRHTYLIYKKDKMDTPLKKAFLSFIKKNTFDCFFLLKKVAKDF